jgi:hypothetical protein
MLKNNNEFKVFYEEITLNSIKKYGNDRFNTNNHWNNDERPSNYF